MAISFSAGCNHINRDVFPAILSTYQVTSELFLPSPIKGEVLFLKKFMRYLYSQHLGFRQSTNEFTKHDLLYSLYGAVKIFNLAFNQQGTCINPPLFSHQQNKISIHIESEMVQCFIITIINWSNQDSHKLDLLRNEDRNFNGLDVITRAVKHFNELQRLELLYASGKPTLKETHSSYTKDGYDYLGLNNRLLACFALPHNIIYNEKIFLGDVKLLLKKINTEKKPADFLTLSITALTHLKWPLTLKYWALKGLSDTRFNNTENNSAYESWQAKFAVYIFCKYQIFNYGIPEKGLAIIPLFGLKEGEIWLNWQNILDKLAKTSIAAIKENTQPLSRNRFYTHNSWSYDKTQTNEEKEIYPRV